MSQKQCRLFVLLSLFLSAFLFENTALADQDFSCPSFTLKKGTIIYLNSSGLYLTPLTELAGLIVNINGATQSVTNASPIGPYNLSSTPWEYTAQQDSQIQFGINYVGAIEKNIFGPLQCTQITSKAASPNTSEVSESFYDKSGVPSVGVNFYEIQTKKILVLYVAGQGGNASINFASFQNAFSNLAQQNANSNIQLITYNYPVQFDLTKSSIRDLATALNQWIVANVDFSYYSGVYIFTHSLGYVVTKTAVLTHSTDISDPTKKQQLDAFYNAANMISISPLLGGEQWAKSTPVATPLISNITNLLGGVADLNPIGSFQQWLLNNDASFKSTVASFETDIVYGDQHLEGIWDYRNKALTGKKVLDWIVFSVLSGVTDPLSYLKDKNKTWYNSYVQEEGSPYTEYTMANLSGNTSSSDPHMALLSYGPLITRIGKKIFGSSTSKMVSADAVSDVSDTTSDNSDCDAQYQLNLSLMYSSSDIDNICSSSDPNNSCVQTLTNENLATQANILANYDYCNDMAQACTNGTNTVIDDQWYQCSNKDLSLEIPQPAGQPPVFNQTADQTVSVNQPLQFSVSAVSPAGSPLIYSAYNMPAGASLNNGSFSWTPAQNQQGTFNVLFDASDGVYDDYMMVQIAAGSASVINTTAPTGGVEINYGAPYSHSPTVNLTLSAQDKGLGVSFMQFSNDNITWSSLQSYSPQTDWTLSPNDGSKTVYAKFTDVTGLTSVPYSAMITLDTSPPAGSISINNGAVTTDSVAVILSLSAEDTESGVSQMQFSNDNNTWSAPETYTNSQAWTLSTANGQKTVYVKFIDGAGNSAVYSSTITLEIIPPTITTQPLSGQVLDVGQTATFSVTATGTSPLSYQWQKNGTNITGATGHSYTIQSVGSGDSGSYTVVVTGPGGSVTSNAATLTVNVPPTITTPPANQFVETGQTATFSVAAVGSAPLSYQWQKNYVNITGATNASYMTPPTSWSEDGNGTYYSVIVTNPAGSVTSGANLGVYQPLAITGPPVNQTVWVGRPVTFRVELSETLFPVTFQWKKNGINVKQETIYGSYLSDEYYIPSTSASDSGAVYTVVVSNSLGTVTSAAATLTVNVPVPVTITAQPADITVPVKQAAFFNVVVSGSAPFSFQWQKNGVNIPGATQQNYQTPTTSASDNGASYRVIVTNPAGTVTSSVAILTVIIPSNPVITTQPSDQAVSIGQTAVFSVVATSTQPLSYQWQKNQIDISGATGSSYTTHPITTNDIGTYYSVRVSNASGASTTSKGANVEVLPVIVTQPANQTVSAGNKGTFTVSAVGSGTLSYQWQENQIKISGATGASYSILANKDSDGGNYRVVVSSPYGTVISNAALLTVKDLLKITTQPVNQTINAGQTAIFDVSAVDTAPLSYQWQINGQNVKGANQSSYVASIAGSYTVEVSDNNGNKVLSNAATLTVNPVYTITIGHLSNGSVSLSPNQTSYTQGTQVTLTPTAGFGYKFTNWSGDINGHVNDNPLTVTMNANKTITAYFKQTASSN